jgi:hypothetical protein
MKLINTLCLRWSIIYKKGYQEFDNVSSIVTSKVKGLGNTIISTENTSNLTNFNDYIHHSHHLRNQDGTRTTYRLFDVKLFNLKFIPIELFVLKKKSENIYNLCLC